MMRAWYAREPQRQRDDRGLHRARRTRERAAARRVLRRLALPAGEAHELVDESAASLCAGAGLRSSATHRFAGDSHASQSARSGGRHGRRSRAGGAGRRRHVRITGARRPVLPSRRQRRLRRRPLRAHARLHPDGQPPRGKRADRRDRHAGARPLRSRPARLRDLAPGGQRQAGDLLPRWPGAADHAARPARRRQRVHRPRRLCGNAVRGDGPRRLDRGLGPDPRRCRRRQRAAGHAGLVPGQRQPARQGDLRLRDHGPRGDHGAGQRGPAVVGHDRRQDDVALAPGLPDGALPRHGDQRQVRPRPPDGPERAADLQRRRQRPEPEAQGDGEVAALDGARHRLVLQRPLRRVPVRGGRRDHRPGARRRLLPGDADQAGLRLRARRADGRARALAHVVRGRRHADGVADIWIHEGFATFSEWIWTERHGGQTAQQAFDERYADKQFPWSPAPAALERGRRCSPPRSTTAAA